MVTTSSDTPGKYPAEGMPPAKGGKGKAPVKGKFPPAKVPTGKPVRKPAKGGK